VKAVAPVALRRPLGRLRLAVVVEGLEEDSAGSAADDDCEQCSAVFPSTAPRISWNCWAFLLVS